MKVIINNSYSQVTDCTLEEYKALREILSYTIPPAQMYFSGHRGNGKRYLIDKKGFFPTGLLPHVKKYADTCAYPYKSIMDMRTYPKEGVGLFCLSLPVTPYCVQLGAVEDAVRAHRGTISAVTGLGKTVIMALLVQKLQLRTLIIVPNLELKRQLKESFLSYFGSIEGITIENIDSKELQKQGDYDVLICDEAHRVAAKTYRDLNKKYWNNIYYRYFFTATPWRTRDEENILFESIAGQVIYEITYKDAVDIGAIVPVEAYYIEIPVTKTTQYSYQEVYKELVVNNKKRNDIIYNLLDVLANERIPTLCLVKEIKHGEKFKEFYFANGQDDDTQHFIKLFNDGKMKTLIGTVGVLGEGVDSRPAEYVVIAGLGKSRGQFMQQVGRALRRYPGKETAKIVIFLDKSHKWTRAHFNAQKKILAEEYDCKVMKLVL